jgi:polyisoprenyl-teichoic acid--peptidoglycan teichoic acid transferase
VRRQQKRPQGRNRRPIPRGAVPAAALRSRARRSVRRPRPTRWRRVAGSVLGTALCLGGLTAGALWSLHGGPLGIVGSMEKPFGGKNRVNILVLGLDDGQGGQSRSDTMLLVHVDTTARRLTALSIPRDTRVPLGSGRFAKINAAHARGGPLLAARAVADLIGRPVDYTLTTDFAGFSRLVDLVGGLDLNVERAMDYEDHWGHLAIHFKPGPQHLDGPKAIQYVRFRKSSGHRARGDGSDISRIARQQKFLEALTARCFLGVNLVRLPEIVREGRREIHTDLATADLLYIAGLAKEIGADQLKLLNVPGTTAMIGGQSYWLPSENELPAVLRQLEGAPVPVSVTVALSRDHSMDRALPGRG